MSMNVLWMIKYRLFSLKTFLFGPICNEILVCFYWINQSTSVVSLILFLASYLTAWCNYILLSICITPSNFTDILLNCISLKSFNKCELKFYISRPFKITDIRSSTYYFSRGNWGPKKRLNIKYWKLSGFPQF